MSDEPKRNIVIESDDISSFALGFDGEGFTRIVRSLWVNGQSLRGLVCLMQGIRGLNFDVAVKILEGKLKLVGVSPTMKVVVDNAPGLPSLDRAMAEQDNARVMASIGEQSVNPPRLKRQEELDRQQEMMMKFMEKKG